MLLLDMPLLDNLQRCLTRHLKLGVTRLCNRNMFKRPQHWQERPELLLLLLLYTLSSGTRRRPVLRTG